MGRKILIIVVLVGLGFGAGGLMWRVAQHWENTKPAPNVPVEVNVANTNSQVNTNQNVNQPVNQAVTTLPAEINLSAPFTTQAPNANWDQVHEELCEEASVLMAARALQGRTIKDAADAEAALQQLKSWEMEHLGFYESTTAAETVQLIVGQYGLQASLLKNPTVDDIKRALASNSFVIVPAAGRMLGNPNFKQPGPLYHMLLIKGYDRRGEFITNDPGTRKGQNYVYQEAVIMNAIHDWNNGDVEHGQKVVIVVSR